ncbi:hypothetical protein NPIL_145251, partial [Nephila pilipes]
MCHLIAISYEAEALRVVEIRNVRTCLSKRR